MIAFLGHIINREFCVIGVMSKKKIQNLQQCPCCPPKDRKSISYLYVVLSVLVIIILLNQLYRRDWQGCLLCLLSLFLFSIPSFIEKHWNVDIPSVLETIILLFIFASQILGELYSCYQKIPIWDSILHLTAGFTASAIGFSLFDILNKKEVIKMKLSPFFLAMTAFCFSMTTGVIWEFFEYFMDTLFDLDMQKDTIVHTINTVSLDMTVSNKVVSIENIQSVYINGRNLSLGGYLDIGLVDTMKDLFVNFVGALAFSFIGFFYAKGRCRFARAFILKMKEDSNN